MMAMTNHGAREIEAGELESAIQCLTQALQYCKKFTNDDSTRSHTVFDLSTLMENGYQAMRSRADKQMDSTSSVTSILYSNPIHLPEDAFQFSDVHVEVAIFSTIIFNLALAHQLYSMIVPEQHIQSHVLVKAANLYDLAIRLQKEDCSWAGAPPQYSRLYILACLNNLGLVYQSLGQDESSQYCSQCLLSLLMCFTLDGISSSKSSQWSDYSTFFRATEQGPNQTAPAA
jgi:hypothetical protein